MSSPNCSKCTLNKCKRIKPRGSLNADIMIVGEAPGRLEANMGIPFVGDSGRDQAQFLLKVGIDELDCYLTNIVMCRPPDNRDPTAEEIACCRPRLLTEIETVNPKVIVAVGRLAASELLGREVKMATDHGIPWLKDGRIILPVYHPAASLHGSTRFLQHTRNDYAVIKDIIDGRIAPRTSIEGATFNELVASRPIDVDTYNISHSKEFMAIDTETVDNKLWSIQLTTDGKDALFIPADNKQVLKTTVDYINNFDGTIIFHAALADLPLLQDVGVKDIKFTDTMVMAYLLQTEPQGLKALAYRLLNIKMQSYVDTITPATFDKALNYLSEVANREWPDADKLMEITKNGEIRYKQPQNIQKKAIRIIHDAFSRGADPYDRWYNIKQQERIEVERELGIMRMGELNDIPFNDAIHYACLDAIVTFRVHDILKAKINGLNLNEVLRIDLGIIEMVSDMIHTGFLINVDVLKVLDEEYHDEMHSKLAEIKELTGISINPDSSNQVRKLMQELKLWSKGKRSTESKYLLAEVDRHPVVAKILEYREIGKLVSTYTTPLQYKIDSNNRLHTELTITRTATGRLASKNPNLQNIPVRTTRGLAIRRAFITPEGYSLIGADYSQIEMRVAAHVANDEKFIKLFINGEDIHAYTASKIFGIPLQHLDDKKHRKPAKAVGFGVLYGITSKGLAARLKDWSEAECENLIKEWFDLYKGVASYMKDVVYYAKRHGYVSDMFGRIRYIPEIYSKDNKIYEQGVRYCRNTPIQSGAGGILKIAMSDLTPIYKSVDYMRPIMQIHDELIFEVQDEHIDEASMLIQSTMESCYNLKVPIKVDIAVAKSWIDLG